MPTINHKNYLEHCWQESQLNYDSCEFQICAATILEPGAFLWDSTFWSIHNGCRIILTGWQVRLVIFFCLITPDSPVLARPAAKQTKILSSRTTFDDVVLSIRLATIFALTCYEQVELTSPKRKRSDALAAHSKKSKSFVILRK